MAADRELILRVAIDERLRAARGRLSLGASQPFPEQVAADPEESLRVLMVRLWPRVAGGRATVEDLAQFYERLEELWQPARSSDLRFLDAWNNAYEAAGDGFPEHMVAAYVELLDEHARRLRGETRGV